MITALSGVVIILKQVMRQKYFQTALETKGRKRWKNKIFKEKRDCVQKHYFSSLVSFSLQTKFINRSFAANISIYSLPSVTTGGGAQITNPICSGCRIPSQSKLLLLSHPV